MADVLLLADYTKLCLTKESQTPRLQSFSRKMGQEGFHHALKIGHQIHWYTIDKVLGQGGFGITYLGHDNNLDQRVAIKEFLPTEFAVRADDQSVKPITQSQEGMYDWALDRFITEARTLARFDHPNIVRVMAVFEENNAAYMVMRYEEGQTLDEIFNTRGTLSQTELLDIVLPIIDGLKIVHDAGFIHRDIKPANIFIREDGSPVLIDFGSARQSIGAQTQTLTTLISPGYSPIEQYFTKGEDQGPWTDIYGLASTLYRGMAGRRPVDTMTRSKQILSDQPDPYVPALEAGKGRYSQAFLQAIDNGLQFRHQHRPQDIATWKKQLLREGTVESAVNPDEATMPAPVLQEEEQKTRVQDDGTTVIHTTSELDSPQKANARKIIWIALASVLVLIIISIMVALVNRSEKPEDAITPQVPSVVEGQSNGTTGDRSSKVDSLLEQAEQDMKANRLTVPHGNNAFERYREVLTIEPRNQIAKKGLQDVVTRKMYIIQNAIQERDLKLAQKHIDQMMQLMPDNKKLKELRDLVAEARKR
jgi:serine/threonine protein kinase